jgi:hypothetical protein
MTAGKDVTSIKWEPVHKGRTGEVTIEHECSDTLTVSMNLDAARRLVNRLLGSDNVELSSPGDCFRWHRKALTFRLSD